MRANQHDAVAKKLSSLLGKRKDRSGISTKIYLPAVGQGKQITFLLFGGEYHVIT